MVSVPSRYFAIVWPGESGRGARIVGELECDRLMGRSGSSSPSSSSSELRFRFLSVQSGQSEQ